jgi:hypothetical protein
LTDRQEMGGDLAVTKNRHGDFWNLLLPAATAIKNPASTYRKPGNWLAIDTLARRGRRWKFDIINPKPRP